MKVALPGRRKSRIEMIPLIDIVFLLLVVFIYAMLSMAVHRGLPVALPASRAAEIEKSLVLSVTMQRNGSVYLDKVPVPLEELTQTLRSRAEGQANRVYFCLRTKTYPTRICSASLTASGRPGCTGFPCRPKETSR